MTKARVQVDGQSVGREEARAIHLCLTSRAEQVDSRRQDRASNREREARERRTDRCNALLPSQLLVRPSQPYLTLTHDMDGLGITIPSF